MLNGPRYQLFRYKSRSFLSSNFFKEDNDESDFDSDSELSIDEEDENSVMLTQEEDSCGRRFNIYIY